MACKIIKIVIFLWFLVPGLAIADDGKQLLENHDLLKIFTQYITADSPWPSQNIEVMKFTARPDTLSLPEGKIGHRLAGPVPPKHPGFKSLELIISVNGKDHRRVKLGGELHLFGEVACTVSAMGRGEVIESDNVKMVRSDLTWQSEGAIFDKNKVVGKKLTNSLRAGSIVMERNLEERPLVDRGDAVKIVTGKASLKISVPGQVRDSGVEGELVRVKNMMSRKIVLARVRDDKTVVIDY